MTDKQATELGPIRLMEIAVCDHDRCPWKYRGASASRTLNEAEVHVARTGHEVTLIVDKRTTISPREDTP